MSVIQIHVNREPTSPSPLNIPIEVWREQYDKGPLKFVSLQLASESVSAKPGVYQIRALFPYGRHVDKRIKVKSREERISVYFNWHSGEEIRSQQWQCEFSESQDRNVWDLTRFEWDSQDNTYKYAECTRWQEGTPYSVTTQYNTSIIILCVSMGNEGQSNDQYDLLVAPCATGLPAAVELVRETYVPAADSTRVLRNAATTEEMPIHLKIGSRTKIRFVPHHTEAFFLLNYLRTGAQQEAAVLMHSTAFSAQKLLQGKHADPIAAVLGGLAMVRLGLTEKLGRRARLLYKYRDWLPDGLVLFAFQEYQRNRIQESIDLLLEFPDRRLPVFTDALRLALDLARFLSYSDDMNENQSVGLQQLRLRLGFVADHADLSEPVLTLRNISKSVSDRILGLNVN